MELLIRFIPNTPHKLKQLLVESLGLRHEFEDQSVRVFFESEEEMETFRKHYYAAAHISPEGAFRIEKSSLYPDGRTPEVKTKFATVEITGSPEIRERLRENFQETGRLRYSTTKDDATVLMLEMVGDYELETLEYLVAYATGDPQALTIKEVT